MAFLSVAQINIIAAAATVCNIYGWKKQQEKENRFRWNNGHGNKSAHWWRPNLMLCVFISLTNLHPFACFFFFFCVLCGVFLLSVWNTFAPMWMFSSFMIAFEADRCMRKWATERERVSESGRQQVHNNVAMWGNYFETNRTIDDWRSYHAEQHEVKPTRWQNQAATWLLFVHSHGLVNSFVCVFRIACHW